MKTERRHELQTNQLADWLGRQIENIRPHFTTILTVVAVLIVAMIGYGIWSSRSQEAAAEAWTSYFNVSFAENTYTRSKQEVLRTQELERFRDELRKQKNDPAYELTEGEQRLVQEQLGEKLEQAVRDDITAMARQYAGTKLGTMAEMRAGDLALFGGINAMFPTTPGQPRDLKKATTLLDDAIRYYERALEQAAGDTLLERRLRFGLARAYEARNAQDAQREANDDTKLALAQYERLSTGDDVFAAASRAEIKVLKNKDNMYNWFASMLSTTGNLPGGGNLFPDSDPFERFHSEIPGAGQMPDIDFNDITDPLPPGSGSAPSSNP